MALAHDQQTNSDSAAPQDFVNLPTPQPRKPNLDRQFKNRKAVDPYGKERKARKASSSSVTKTETNTQAASNVPDTIQWGDMMISKDANPEAWEKYAAKIRAGEKSPGGFPTAPQAQDEAIYRNKLPTRGLATVPAGTIREPLFGRNPDGSPKSRPAGMDADEVAALAAAQERKYSPPQKATKEKTAPPKERQTPVPTGGWSAANVSPVNPRTSGDLLDMYGNRVKLADMYISGGIAKSAEGKKESAEAKRKAAQAAPKEESGGEGGGFRVINGQVRFFGSGADAAKEVDPVKPTGMR